MPSAGRQDLTEENLEKNHITICRTPDEKRWPKYVSEFRSQLVGSFLSLAILEGVKGTERGIPHVLPDRTGSEDLKLLLSELELKNKDQKRSRIIYAMKNIYQEYQGLVQRQQDGNEHEWKRIWEAIFGNVIMENKRETRAASRNQIGMVCDKLFCKTAPARLYDVEDCQLKLPKPDTTFGFTAAVLGDNLVTQEQKESFEKCLKKLWKEHKLLVSPFKEDLETKCNLYFPWGIFEGKSADSKRIPLGESQAANAAVKCLMMLDNLRKSPGSPPKRYQTGTATAIPIPCLTCKGEKWELWICYSSAGPGNEYTTYRLDKVFGGTMKDLRSCVELVQILERLKDWALETFKPWVNKYLRAWIEYANVKQPYRPKPDPKSKQGKKQKAEVGRKRKSNLTAKQAKEKKEEKEEKKEIGDDSGIHLEDESESEMGEGKASLPGPNHENQQKQWGELKRQLSIVKSAKGHLAYMYYGNLQNL